MSAVTDAGFVKSRLPDLQAQLRSNVAGAAGQDADTDFEEPDGQFCDNFAMRLADLHDLAEDTYNGLTPDGVTQAAQAARIGRINGIERLSGEYAIAPLTLNGDAGTVVPVGSVVVYGEYRFALLENATIGPGGSVAASAQCTTTGVVLGTPATSVLTIGTVVKGWASVGLAGDITGGAAQETLAEMRLRRAQTVAAPSQAMTDGLVGALLNVNGVARACVYEKMGAQGDQDVWPGGVASFNGLWCVLQGGLAAADIAQVLYLHMGMGAALFASQSPPNSYDVTDSQGFLHTMQWDQAELVPVFLWVTVANAPSDAQQQVSDALAAWGADPNNVQIGGKLGWVAVLAAINAATNLDVQDFHQGLTSDDPGAPLDLPPIDKLTVFTFSLAAIKIVPYEGS
jgi:hypothetical protein